MRFIESILLRDGNYINLELHQQRMDNTFKTYAAEELSHDLIQILPHIKLEGTYKVRLIYDLDSEDAEYDIEFAAYHPRKIESLQVVSSKPFDYAFKYEDRNHINKLISQSSADDILIAINDRITDGSYFNLALWDGEAWLTPDSFLLNGVRRQQLLNEAKIKESTIQIQDLKNFERISLINAMMDLGELELPISAIDIPKNHG
ncbi:aminotransferase class IV [Ekhidna sp.]|uniref:aminotransferase class IV n=1 Tax=Ekhidna sp. TaxID=2608089 RepID=UPI003CCC28E0